MITGLGLTKNIQIRYF